MCFVPFSNHVEGLGFGWGKWRWFRKGCFSGWIEKSCKSAGSAQDMRSAVIMPMLATRSIRMSAGGPRTDKTTARNKPSNSNATAHKPTQRGGTAMRRPNLVTKAIEMVRGVWRLRVSDCLCVTKINRVPKPLPVVCRAFRAPFF